MGTPDEMPTSASSHCNPPPNRSKRKLGRESSDLEGDSFRQVPEKGAERGKPMPERCKQCERYEKSLKELRERRINLWRRGELTDAASEKLAADEQRIDEELREHRAAEAEITQMGAATHLR